MASAGSGSSPALPSPKEREPRRIEIRVPPWALLLPVAALACYFIATPSGWFASSSASASAEPRSEPRLTFEPAPRPATAERSVPPQPDPSSEARAAGATELAQRQQAQARELAAARENVELTVYFTEWCPACRSLALLREFNKMRDHWTNLNRKDAKTAKGMRCGSF